jgi:hypothetical protein
MTEHRYVVSLPTNLGLSATTSEVVILIRLPEPGFSHTAPEERHRRQSQFRTTTVVESIKRPNWTSRHPFDTFLHYLLLLNDAAHNLTMPSIMRQTLSSAVHPALESS